MKTNPIITTQAIKLAKAFRHAVAMRDKAPTPENENRLAQCEVNAKDNPVAWALLTAISSDELTTVFASVWGQYRWEQTRGGMRCRYLIKSGLRYSSKANFYYGMTPEEASKPSNNPVVYLKPLRTIEKKLAAVLN